MPGEQPTFQAVKLVLTCEHAGNEIPKRFRDLFVSAGEVLQTHRGYDPGAHDLFEYLKPLSDFQHSQNQSRLLVEVNRSLHHRQLFSEYTRELPAGEKELLLKEFYFPYRDLVKKNIAEFLKAGEEVLHLSIHSFTPVLYGEERRTDIGLLYDSGRILEKKFCKELKQVIINLDPARFVRFNYPYKGKADGFTTFLRKKFSKGYRGIEIEVNQKYVKNDLIDPDVKSILFEAIREVVKSIK